MPYPPITEIHNFTPGNTARIVESLEAARNGDLREWVVYSDSSSTGAVVGAGFDHLLGWPTLMLDELELDGVPIAGTGFVRILDNILVDARWSATGSWHTQHKTFAFTLADGATATFTTNLPGDRVTVRYLDGGAAEPGEFTISVAGGTPTTVSSTATQAWRNVTLNESIAAGQTVVLTKTSGTYMAPFAVCVWNTTGGLLLHNIGQGGSRAHGGSGTAHDRWIEDDDKESLGQITPGATINGDPAAVFISLGGNDKKIGVDVSDADVMTALTTIVGRNPNSDHVLIAEHQLRDTLVPRATWEAFLAALHTHAETTLGVPLIDHDDRLGPYTQIVADGKNADTDGHLTAATLEDLGRSTAAQLLTLGEPMANALYDAAKKAFLDADIDLLVDTIKVQLVDTADYTVNLSTHDNLDDVLAAARVGTAGTLANKTTTAGVFDADDVTLSSVTGDVSEALVIYKDTGVESTSKLIAYIDSATGLPVTPNGGNIVISWDSGANKIFKIG